MADRSQSTTQGGEGDFASTGAISPPYGNPLCHAIFEHSLDAITVLDAANVIRYQSPSIRQDAGI